MRTTDEQITTEGGTPTQIESTQVQVAGRWYWPDSYAYRKVLEARIAALESREAAITVRAEPANLAAVEAWFYEWAEANVLGPREVAQFKRRLHAITARPTPANWADMLKWLGKFGSWFESVNVAGPHEIDQYVKAKPMPTAPADDNILAVHPAKPSAEASDMIDRALALRMAGLQQTIAELEAERDGCKEQHRLCLDEIERLRTDNDSMQHRLEIAGRDTEALERRLAKRAPAPLAELAAMLPKTIDGVQVVPGMKLWTTTIHRWAVQIEVVSLDDLDSDWPATVLADFDGGGRASHYRCHVQGCYSTHAAALAGEGRKP